MCIRRGNWCDFHPAAKATDGTHEQSPCLKTCGNTKAGSSATRPSAALETTTGADAIESTTPTEYRMDKKLNEIIAVR
jgi:hypothetical protein